MKPTPQNLDDLLILVLSGTFNDQEMTSLPTFGGEVPAINRCFSWDATRLLMQTTDGFRIVPRGDVRSNACTCRGFFRPRTCPVHGR